jgi:hypothetical protein
LKGFLKKLRTATLSVIPETMLKLVAQTVRGIIPFFSLPKARIVARGRGGAPRARNSRPLTLILWFFSL